MLLIFILLSAISCSIQENCIYNNTNATCYDLSCYTNLKRSIRSLELKNSCDFQVNDWVNFSPTFPELEQMKFTPICKSCLHTDDHISQNLKIEGRCLTKNAKFPNLTEIKNELAACLFFIILLTMMYLMRFIKNEIFH